MGIFIPQSPGKEFIVFFYIHKPPKYISPFLHCMANCNYLILRGEKQASVQVPLSIWTLVTLTISTKPFSWYVNKQFIFSTLPVVQILSLSMKYHDEKK
jgi:hypothetical protein